MWEDELMERKEVRALLVGDIRTQQFVGCNNIREKNDLIIIEDKDIDGTSRVHAVIPKHALIMAWHVNPKAL